MVLVLVVGRDLACFWSGRAFDREFGYLHDLRPFELLNSAEVKQGNWNEQDSRINHTPSMVFLVPLICICDASVLEKRG